MVRSKKVAVSGIKDSLKLQGVRLTRQREILLELIDKSGKHLDAETLYSLAKEQDPKLNRVTVYRTLKMLKMSGLVDELDLMHYGGDQHYYETRLKQEHAHVICLRCGKVEEFFGEPLHKLRKQVEQHFGFQIILARTEIGGYCPHCQVLRAREVEEAARESAHPASGNSQSAGAGHGHSSPKRTRAAAAVPADMPASVSSSPSAVK
jgi:Fur family transcriptional regulator, ferric uptake regulator